MEHKMEGMEVKETQLPGQEQAPEPQKPKGRGLIVIGVVLLIVGLVITTYLLLTWKNAQQISERWEGSDDEGYYKYYDEGNKAIVLGEITLIDSISDILADPINYSVYDVDYYQDLYNMGYRYAFFLDDEYDLEIYSKEDVGDEGDDISLELRLSIMELGGNNYWVWDAKSIERPSALPFYILGIIAIVIGVVLMGIGTKKYLSSKRSKR
jgi:hypothetical protein